MSMRHSNFEEVCKNFKFEPGVNYSWTVFIDYHEVSPFNPVGHKIYSWILRSYDPETNNFVNEIISQQFETFDECEDDYDEISKNFDPRALQYIKFKPGDSKDAQNTIFG